MPRITGRGRPEPPHPGRGSSSAARRIVRAAVSFGNWVVAFEAEAGRLLFAPQASLLDLLVGLRSKDYLKGHFPSGSLRRTSSLGIADSGFARCSARLSAGSFSRLARLVDGTLGSSHADPSDTRSGDSASPKAAKTSVQLQSTARSRYDARSPSFLGSAGPPGGTS